MAKTEGTQSVPSEWLDSYRATLGEQRPNLAVHKRYPWKLPNMQAGKSGVSAGQRIQRARFITVRDSFKTLSQAERERWYDSMPPWGSLLWYYNYFIMSGLMDVLGADAKGASVIKSLQNRVIEVPAGGTTITHDTPIDASKAVVMIWGASYDMITVLDPDLLYHYPVVQTYPIWGTLNNTNISITWALAPDVAAKIALQVIEYI